MCKMCRIMSFSDIGKELIWIKNNNTWNQSLVDDDQYEPDDDYYSFNTFLGNSHKTLFYATDQFSHGIKIQESTGNDNDFKIAITPINHTETTSPVHNLIVSSNAEMNASLEFPFKAPPIPPEGIEVYVENKYDNSIELSGLFNDQSFKDAFSSNSGFQKLGKENLITTLEFSITFCHPLDHVHFCSVSINLGKTKPMLTFSDRKGYSVVSLTRINLPETVNITIEPD